MGQSKVPEPAHTLDDAVAAATRIRVVRARGNADPDLDFYPAPTDDDEYVDAAIDYLHRHRKVPDKVVGDIAADWALLVSYQRQRDERRNAARELHLIELAQRVKVGPAVWGPNLGLSRQNVWHRRQTLALLVRGTEKPPTRAQAEADRRQTDDLESWLAANAGELLDAAQFLIQRADELGRLLPDGRAAMLPEAMIAVEIIQDTPSPPLASAVGYAMWLLAPAAQACGDPDARTAIVRGRRLHDEYDALTPAPA